jgi:hypothetical protein
VGGPEDDRVTCSFRRGDREEVPVLHAGAVSAPG